MNILIVCSGNAPGFVFEKNQAFIYDQVKATEKQEPAIHFDYFFIDQKGVGGYLGCLKKLRARLAAQKYDWIHAHFATSALLANLQRRVPVVATFHGSDINLRAHRILSALVELMSKKTIYVSEQLLAKALLRLRNHSVVIPCGVDFELFLPKSKAEARRALGLSLEKKYILFSSSFENAVKNYPLAKAAVELLPEEEIELLALKNLTRRQVAQLMPAMDVALMTSFTEGSPQFVKEALACNLPVVSTDVGDVRQVLKGIQGCYLTTYEPEDVAQKITLALRATRPVCSREHIGQFDNRLIAGKLLQVYSSR